RIANREPRPVRVIDGHWFPSRVLRLRIERIRPDTEEPISIGKRVQPIPVGRPMQLVLSGGAVGDRNPGAFVRTLIAGERGYIYLRPIWACCVQRNPVPVWRPLKLIEAPAGPLQKHAALARLQIHDRGPHRARASVPGQYSLTIGGPIPYPGVALVAEFFLCAARGGGCEYSILPTGTVVAVENLRTIVANTGLELH